MGSICIFAHFNKNNSLEEYVIDYLETIKELVDEVIFISTSDIDKDKRSLLKKIVNKIIIKENEGYDFGSWKEGLIFIKNNYENLPKEIILCNDSCYISKKLVRKAFHKMRNNKMLDFWGITINYSIFKHIQSYFIVLNSMPLRDSRFWELVNSWQNQNHKTDYIMYEIGLSKFLLKQKYKMCTYINISKINILFLSSKNKFKVLINYIKKLIRYSFNKESKKNKVSIKSNKKIKAEYLQDKNKKSFLSSLNKLFNDSLNLTITHLDIKDFIKIKLPFLKVNKVQEILDKEELYKLEILCSKNGFNLNQIIKHQKNICTKK